MQVLVHLGTAKGANQVEQIEAILDEDTGKVYARLGDRWWMLSKPGTLGWRSFNVGLDCASELSLALDAYVSLDEHYQREEDERLYQQELARQTNAGYDHWGRGGN
jgi:hypothetical protein